MSFSNLVRKGRRKTMACMDLNAGSLFISLLDPLHGNTTQTFLSLKPPAWKYLADENTTADANIENPQNNFRPK